MAWDFWEVGVSPSFVSQFLRCKGTTYLKYIKRWRSSRTSEALQFGSACHYVLERAYKKKKRPSREKIKKWLLKYQYSEGREKTFQLPSYQLAMGSAWVVMDHYFDFYKLDFQSEWLELEGDFRYPYKFDDGKETFIHGIRDGVYRHGKNAQLIVFDTKCKGRIVLDDIFDSFPLNFQFNAYTDVWDQEHGELPNGIECNVIRIPQIKVGKDGLKKFLERLHEDVVKRPEFYFMRPFYRVTRDDIAKWRKEQLHPIMQDIRNWVDNDYHPRYFSETGLMVGHRRSDYFHAACNGDFSGLERKKD